MPSSPTQVSPALAEPPRKNHHPAAHPAAQTGAPQLRREHGFPRQQSSQPRVPLQFRGATVATNALQSCPVTKHSHSRDPSLDHSLQNQICQWLKKCDLASPLSLIINLYFPVSPAAEASASHHRPRLRQGQTWSWLS